MFVHNFKYRTSIDNVDVMMKLFGYRTIGQSY